MIDVEFRKSVRQVRELINEGGVLSPDFPTRQDGASGFAARPGPQMVQTSKANEN